MPNTETENPDNGMPLTVDEAYDALGIERPSGASPGDMPEPLEEAIRRAYRTLAKQLHPDKGGDVERFQTIEEAYSLLSSTPGDSVLKPKLGVEESCEHYAAAPKKSLPPLCIEQAKSDKSICQHTKTPIPKDALRLGARNGHSGTYDGWRLPAFPRVPNALQGLTAFTEEHVRGIEGLTQTDRDALETALRNPENWVQTRTPKKGPASPPADGTVTPVTTAPSPDQTLAAVPVDKEVFVRPTVGVDTVANCLKGCSIVATGIFPEIGGGAGLRAGKEGLETIVTDHGGKLVGSISKKTAMLVVGREPGASKLTKAASNGVKRVSLKTFMLILERGAIEPEQGEPPDPEPIIHSLSSGFGGNGLGKRLRGEELAQIGVTPQTPAAAIKDMTVEEPAAKRRIASPTTVQEVEKRFPHLTTEAYRAEVQAKFDEVHARVVAATGPRTKEEIEAAFAEVHAKVVAATGPRTPEEIEANFAKIYAECAEGKGIYAPAAPRAA